MMNLNWSSLTTILWSNDNAVLPEAALMQVALQLSWAIVLGSLVFWVLNRWGRAWPPQLKWAFSALTLCWTLWPGELSPAYWLGLAFQMPSLSSSLLALWCWWHAARSHTSTAAATSPADLKLLEIWAGSAVVLGWVLLADTLAWLPWSVYAWGFSPVVVAGVSVWLMGSWAMFRAVTWRAVVWPLALLLLFVLTRLPSGNVWDAVLDPILWLALQVRWIIKALQQRHARHQPLASK